MLRSLKPAQAFSARRRTTSVFFANPVNDTASSYTWIDNTPDLWASLHSVLEQNKPAKIAINVDPDVAFSSGLHAGEYFELTTQLGPTWKDRMVSVPEVAVEYVATMPEAQIGWYRRLMETAWAMIDEAFSERVITPGETSTDVSECSSPWREKDRSNSADFVLLP